MPLSELPLSALVVLFLTVFVMIGIYPALKRTAARLRQLLEDATQEDEPFSEQRDGQPRTVPAEPSTSRSLNDYEIFVLRRLAQDADKALSRQQLNARLLFGKAKLDSALHSLHRKGLIQVILSPLLGQRFALSRSGRAYAFEQGYIVLLREHDGLLR